MYNDLQNVTRTLDPPEWSIWTVVEILVCANGWLTNQLARHLLILLFPRL